MADIQIRDLPEASPASPADWVAIDNATTRKVSIADLVGVGRPFASQAEAEAGVNSTKVMSPLTTAQAIAAQGGSLFASAAEGLLASTALQPSAIGVSVQAYDVDLTAIAGLPSAANKSPYATGPGAWALMDVTAAARAFLDDNDAASQRSTLGLGTAATQSASAFATSAQGAKADTALQPSAIGSSVQAYDADLAAIAGLTSSANKAPYATGVGTWAMMDVTAAGRAILDDANASAQRTTLGLGSAATANSTDFATAAQGSLADSAVQPGDLATVATTGSYNDLSGRPAFASGTEADAGVSSVNLMAPSTTKRAIDNAIGKYGSFAGNSFGNWSITGSGATSIVQVSDEGFVYQSVGSTILELPMLARVKGRQYRIKARIRTTANPTVAGQDRVFVGFAMFDNLGARTYSYVAANGVNLPSSSGWVEYQGTIDCDTLASTIVQICPRIILNYNGGDGTQQIQSLSVEPLDATKLSTANGIARTSVARFGDTFDIKEFGFDVSGAVGTEATNNAAFDRLIAHATSNPGMVYRGRKGDTIRWNAGLKTIPRSKLRLEGGELHWTGDYSGTASVPLTLAQYVDFDALRVVVPAGGLFRRMLLLSGDNRGDLVSVECANQVNNYGGNTLDRAIAVYGHRNNIRLIKAKNVDWAAIIWGNGGAGSPQLDTTIGEFDIENFVSGAWVRNVTRYSGPNGRARGKSPNALPDPGHNAFLVEGAIDSTFGTYELFDSGEHNFRFGGVHSSEQLTKNCSVAGLRSGRSGQCGFKIWSGLNTNVIDRLTVGPLNIIDCGGYAQGLSNPPAFNDFGVMVQGLRNSTFSTINVMKDSYTYAALDGGYFSQCEDVSVDTLQVENSYRNLLRISEYNGNVSDSNSSNSLRFGKVLGSGHLSEGIVVEVPTTGMRDLKVSDFDIIGGTDVVRWTGTAARAIQRCYFRGGGRGQSGALFNVPVDPKIRTVDIWA